MEIFKNILKGISIAVGVLLLVVFLIGTIGFSAWLTATAKHEYVTDTVYCMDKHRHGTSNMVSSNGGTVIVNGTNYEVTFKYKGEKIELNDENIYDQIKINKKYRAKIKVETYKNGTKWYEIQKIIAEK